MRAWVGLGLLWASAAGAVDQPSSYAGCTLREATVAWGGSVTVDLSDCHAFGLGVVSQAPRHGSTSAGDPDPVDSYVYTHRGSSPVGGGSDSFVVRDDNSDLITVRITIGGSASPIAAVPAALPPLVAGKPLRLELGASGGSPPYVFRRLDGRLPTGLSLDDAGLLQGTPTQRGAYAFTLQVQDAGGATAKRGYAGSVAPGSLELVPAQVTVVQGAPVSQVLSATGGVPPLRFLAESAADLPSGLQLAADGMLAGTTAVPAGGYPVRVRITDASTGSGEFFEVRTLALAVSAPPTVTIAASPASVAEDGATPLVFTLARGAALATDTLVTLRASGSAVFASGKRAAPLQLRIPAGATTASFRVWPLADARPEPDETVVFTVEPGAGYAVGTPASASATVLDDERP